MLTSLLMPRWMQSDRPQCQAETMELKNDDVRKAIGLPPQAHADANDEQFEQLLVDTHDVELLKNMLRRMRRELQGALFAARTNADTIEAIRRRDRRG
jgi:hypothetical protein